MLGAAPPLMQVLVCAPAGLAGGAVAVLVLERPRTSAFYAWRTVRHSLARQWSGAA
jgi:hypothetical protein